ncbi:mRNA turnover 4 [Chamberlinius hualienensis]
MPRSRRDKKVSLTKLRRKGLDLKQHLIDDIRENVSKYSQLFLFSVSNMRNTKLKDLRQNWNTSRFFFGKNKVMALALGKSPEDECKDNIHKLSNKLKGQCGLLFTNSTKEEVLKYFSKYSEPDYARAGNKAIQTIVLDKGPLPQFPHSMEPQLRQLGLPTSLERGVVNLIKDFRVCKEDDILTPEQARILKLLGNQMADFRITVECVWSSDGSFEELKKKVSDTSDGEEAMESDNEDT